MSKKGICIMTLAFAAALGASDAMATDSKVMPALSCILISGSTALHTYGFGSVVNNGTVDAWVDCPLVRDDTAGILNYMEPTLMDRNQVSNAQCWVASVSRQTGAVSWSPSVSTSGFSNSWQTTPKIYPSTDYDLGSFILECRLPPVDSYGNSGLLSYLYDED